MCFQRSFYGKILSHQTKTQKFCNKAVDDCLPALKSVLDCFVTSKILEKPDDVVFSQHDTDFDCIDSDIVTLFSDDIGLATLIIGDDDFDEGESTTINDVRLMA